MATYYVSKSTNSPPGDNGNGHDGSLALPWRRMDFALQQGVGPGDTVLYRGGTYTEGADFINSQASTVPNGTSFSSAITIGAYNGETVILQPTSGNRAINLIGDCHHIIIENLVIDGANSTSQVQVYFAEGAHHNRLRLCSVKNANKFGILVARNNGHSPYNEFIDCFVHDNGWGWLDDTWGHGLYIGSHHTLVQGGRYYNNRGWGIHCYSDETEGDPEVSDNVIDSVQIDSNDGNGIVFAAGARNVAKFNIIFGHTGDGRCGIQVYTRSSDTGLYRNTIAGNTISITCQFMDGTCIIGGNVLVDNGTDAPIDYAFGGGATMDVVTYDNWLESDGDPLFVGGGDYRLQALSPCGVDGPVIVGVDSDYDGYSVPQGATPAFGAFEIPAAATGTVVPVFMNQYRQRRAA